MHALFMFLWLIASAVALYQVFGLLSGKAKIITTAFLFAIGLYSIEIALGIICLGGLVLGAGKMVQTALRIL